MSDTCDDSQGYSKDSVINYQLVDGQKLNRLLTKQRALTDKVQRRIELFTEKSNLISDQTMQYTGQTELQLRRIERILEKLTEIINTLFCYRPDPFRGLNQSTLLELNTPIQECQDANRKLDSKISKEQRVLNDCTDKLKEMEAYLQKFSITKRKELDQIKEERIIDASKRLIISI